MARYLVRVANDEGYTPEDAFRLLQQIREYFGSRRTVGHPRIGRSAIEFDLRAKDSQELEARGSLLKRYARVMSVKPLDVERSAREKDSAFKEAVQLFNEERFWECHEALEEIWYPASGAERDILQGLILVASALVQHQRGEKKGFLSLLRKAMAKLGAYEEYSGLALSRVRLKVAHMLETGEAEFFRLW